MVNGSSLARGRGIVRVLAQVLCLTCLHFLGDVQGYTADSLLVVHSVTSEKRAIVNQKQSYNGDVSRICRCWWLVPTLHYWHLRDKPYLDGSEKDTCHILASKELMSNEAEGSLAKCTYTTG